jgi:regulator of replication initiation timing
VKEKLTELSNDIIKSNRELKLENKNIKQRLWVIKAKWKDAWDEKSHISV